MHGLFRSILIFDENKPSQYFTRSEENKYSILGVPIGASWPLGRLETDARVVSLTNPHGTKKKVTENNSKNGLINYSI